MTISNTQNSSLSELVSSTGESFSLGENGNWVSSTQLMEKVASIRKNNPSNAKQCGSSVCSWGDTGGACNASGWGN